MDVCRPPLLLINTGVAALLNQKVPDPGDLPCTSFDAPVSDRIRKVAVKSPSAPKAPIF